MKIYEHKKEFLIKYCDVDFKDELKVSSALAYMEEVACSSADELGFGYSYVKPKGYAFMVSNIVCRFQSPVPLGEMAQVVTWPTPPTHVVFGREYRFTSPSGEVRINGSSRWCLLDVNTRKLLQSKVLTGQNYATYNTTKALDNVQWKIPTFPKEEGELCFALKIANSEYDHNMHVNNTRYADYCLNCFSVAELSQRQLKEFSISYVKQCKEGETLSFYRKQVEEGKYLVHGRNDKDEVVTLCRVEFA